MQNALMTKILNKNKRTDLPEFRPGDTIRVHVKIREGDKERMQAFEGILIARNNSGMGETITVRKISFGQGVERIFPVNAPVIDHIDFVRTGLVRRAKLYYLRGLRGKAARLKERDISRDPAGKSLASAKKSRNLLAAGSTRRAARLRGYTRIAGVDEAGRGSLFGPVFAAAVILSPDTPIRGLRDSKMLPPDRRDILAERIRERAIAWAVAAADVYEIDRINIYQASKLAMKRAIQALDPACDYLLTDAVPLDLGVRTNPLSTGTLRYSASPRRRFWRRRCAIDACASGMPCSRNLGSFGTKDTRPRSTRRRSASTAPRCSTVSASSPSVLRVPSRSGQDTMKRGDDLVQNATA